MCSIDKLLCDIFSKFEEVLSLKLSNNKNYHNDINYHDERQYNRID